MWRSTTITASRTGGSSSASIRIPTNRPWTWNAPTRCGSMCRSTGCAPTRNRPRSDRNQRRVTGRPDLRFHDLRHTALTLLAQQGATVRELMDAAGHADPQTAMRYQHSVSGRAQDLAKRIGNLIPHPTPSKPSDNASKPTTTKSNDSRRRTGNSNSASPRSPIRTAYRRCNRRNTNALELHMIKSSPGARR